MMSTQVLQSAAEGFSGIMQVRLCVCDSDGKTLAAAPGSFHVHENRVQGFAMSGLSEQTEGGMQYCRVRNEYEKEYIVIVEGEDALSASEAKLFAFQLDSLLAAYRNRIDKDSFIRNLLLDNLLLVDIYNRAKKLHIEANQRRAVLMAETKPGDTAAADAVRTLFAGNSGDFVVTVDENSVIVIKEIGAEADGSAVLARSAARMRDALLEIGAEARIACGTIVAEIREVSKSYKEAKLALDVGKIFYRDSAIVAYSSLGIGRLIYQLPMNLCRMFIREIFSGKSPEDFDEETLATIRQFFENNLNVSETSRQLFIHRNTLVYRLDKLQRVTGLDLRVFDDAITFKIALMVVEYMNYMEAHGY